MCCAVTDIPVQTDVDQYTITRTLGIRNYIVTGKLIIKGIELKGKDGDEKVLYNIVYEYVERKTHFGFQGWKPKDKAIKEIIDF
jgi:hypothetical protein